MHTFKLTLSGKERSAHQQTCLTYLVSIFINFKYWWQNALVLWWAFLLDFEREVNSLYDLK